jgi:hypothetical protein
VLPFRRRYQRIQCFFLVRHGQIGAGETKYRQRAQCVFKASRVNGQRYIDAANPIKIQPIAM